MTKLAIVIEHHDFRADTTDLLFELSKYYDITLLSSSQNLDCKVDHKFVHVCSEYTSFDRFLLYIFHLFRHKHFYKTDSIQWKTRKISSKASLKQLLQRLWFLFYEYIPGLFPTLWLLRFLSQPGVALHEYDSILFFTIPSDLRLLSLALSNNIRTFMYLYSWDHPIKLPFVIHNRITYLCWNQGHKKDLVSIHGLEPENIKIVGSTQLAFLRSTHLHLLRTSHSPNRKYIYFIATKGRPEFLKQEIYLLDSLARYLATNHPDIHILYRPYPNVFEFDAHCAYIMSNYNNIFIDSFYKSSDIMSSANRAEKITKIKNALLVIHTGGTIALECACMNSKSIYYTFDDHSISRSLNLPIFLSLGTINRQYHLRRYVNIESPVVIGSLAKLFESVDKLILDPDSLDWQSYNNHIKNLFPVVPIESVARSFHDCIE